MNNPYVSVDIEADGPVPGLYSMVSIGAVRVDDPTFTFYGKIKPVSDMWIPEALAASGFAREETLGEGFMHPAHVMSMFASWLYLAAGPKPRFVSDNAGFDWMFVCYYFHRYYGSNPFGFSCTSLTSLYKGMQKDLRASFKHLRKTKHTHNALDDATGNAEAMRAMFDQGLKV
jgi:hypothetical protein